MASASESETQVTSTDAKPVSVTSRNGYINSMVKFLAWLSTNRRHLLEEEFLEAGSLIKQQGENENKQRGREDEEQTGVGNSLSEATIKILIEGRPDLPPIKFKKLASQDFKTWLGTLRKKDGTKPGYSSYLGHRAALVNLYREHGRVMSRTLEAELRRLFRGLKRQRAAGTGAAQGRWEGGKAPLSFTLLQFLAKEMLQRNSRDLMFARTFLILCWNLMSHAGNVMSVCFEDMELFEDALRIYFVPMKNDQSGNQPQGDPRHIYANPVLPAVCPMLALGLYWLSFHFSNNEKKLFPGNSQEDRLRKILQRFLAQQDVSAELARRGISAKDIGFQSIRKGAAAFVSSGSTACPSSAAIHLRAGWSLGMVQDTSHRYEAAADMHVGRTVCGLPPDRAEFSLLPPRFKTDCNRGIVNKAVGLCFPALPSELTLIAEHALASVLYHLDFLRKTLPPGHYLLRTLPFREDLDFIQEARQSVLCNLPDPAEGLYASGIPPHISTLRELRELSSRLERSMEMQAQYAEDIVSRVADQLIKELDAHAIGGGAVTSTGLRSTIMDCLHEVSATTRASVAPAVAAVEEQQAPNAREGRHVSGQGNEGYSITGSRQVEASTETTTTGRAVYCWGGRLHPVPQDFQLPTGSVSEAWRLWCCGDQVNGRPYPPLRTVHPSDLESRNSRKRFCEYKFLMGLIEAKAKELGLWKTQMTIAEALSTFTACQDVVKVSETSEKNRKRRTSQLSWVTVATLKRKKGKADTA